MTLIAAVALLAGPTAALAQQIGPTNDQYDPSSSQIGQSVASGDPSDPGNSSECGGNSTATGTSGSGDSSCEKESRVIAGLPFTGLDLGLIAMVALLLGGSGIALRRLAGSSAKG